MQAAMLQSWLTLQCQQVTGVLLGAVLVRENETVDWMALACWPESSQTPSELYEIADRVGREQQAVEQDRSEDVLLGFPVELSSGYQAVVLLELKQRSSSGREAAVRLVQWGLTWLSMLHEQQRRYESSVSDTVLELLSGVQNADTPEDAGDYLATELAAKLGCSEVVFGLIEDQHSRVVAFSGKTAFDAETLLVKKCATAMEAVLSSPVPVCYPDLEDTGYSVSPLRELAESMHEDWVCAVPISYQKQCYAVILLMGEHSAPSDRASLLLSQLAHYVAPYFSPSYLTDHINPTKGRKHTRWLTKPRAVCALVLLLTLLAAFWQQPYRLSSTASIEGVIERLVVAPADGFIDSAIRRAGDRVLKGEVLATLDNRDLLLERQKWRSQRVRHRKEYNQALGSYDRGEINVLRAKIDQAEAELELIERQLERLELRAPLDGIVVSGDFHRAMGSPVERGQTLFEIAPLDRYRVAIQVSERDIRFVTLGQEGRLRLAGLPGRALPIKVVRIVPVLETDKEQSFFRVEAELEEGVEELRPGMTGVAKIETAPRTVLWIWLHPLFESVRSWLWKAGLWIA